MTTLYILDVPEFRPVIKVGVAAEGVRERAVGSHVELTSDGPITIDRRATGVGPAVWYSAVGAVAQGRIAQFDKEALRVEPV